MQELTILLAGHFIADFSLQPKYMIADKYTIGKSTLGFLTLVGHCATQALVIGGLALLLGYPEWYAIGVAIFLTHFVIDLGKITGRYGLLIDQLLHYAVICLIVLLV